MNIHEYQAKAVLREFGVPTPRGHAAFSVDEAVKAAEELGGPVWVVKAQIHAGGRGKGGGVKVVKSIEDVRKEADNILGNAADHPADRAQTASRCNRIYMEDGSDDRPRALSVAVWSTGRPRGRIVHRLHRRRHGHRAGGA